jgi:PAP2 superfamily protein
MLPALFSKTWSGFFLRFAIVLAFVAVWFWTQYALGARPAVSGTLGDKVHTFTAGLNAYFASSPRATKILLILSSAFIDAFALFLIGSWLFAARVRPFLGLVLLMTLRQLTQALCALPPPAGMIWHYPGFPSLFVTYSVSTDFFFSGHTAIAVYGAVQLARFRRARITTLAFVVVGFEVATVLALRAHYTMDVFAGAVAALWIAALTKRESTSEPGGASDSTNAGKLG